MLLLVECGDALGKLQALALAGEAALAELRNDQGQAH